MLKRAKMPFLGKYYGKVFFIMEKNDYPWKGCGTEKDITGCRFSLSVMSDEYVAKILEAIGQVDCSKVWSQTDALSTVYRGRRIHVIDGVKACFVHVNDEKTHMTMEATFSKGCLGDVEKDYVIEEDDTLVNYTNEKFQVLSKIAFYPLGVEDYMDHISHVVKMAINKGLYEKSAHYATELSGDVNELFDYFNEVLAYAEENIKHYVLQVTLSVNSPTRDIWGYTSI